MHITRIYSVASYNTQCLLLSRYYVAVQQQAIRLMKPAQIQSRSTSVLGLGSVISNAPINVLPHLPCTPLAKGGDLIVFDR